MSLKNSKVRPLSACFQNGGPELADVNFGWQLDKLKVISRGGQTFDFSKKSRWMAAYAMVIFLELRDILVQKRCVFVPSIWHIFASDS